MYSPVNLESPAWQYWCKQKHQFDVLLIYGVLGSRVVYMLPFWDVSIQLPTAFFKL